MHEGLYAAGREFGLDVVGEKSAGFVIALQRGIKVRDRESSHEQVGLFGGAEFGNRTHFLPAICGSNPAAWADREWVGGLLGGLTQSVKTAKTALIQRIGIAVFATFEAISEEYRRFLAGLDSASVSAMHLTDEQIDRIVEKIIGGGIEVHKEFGPGLLESVYEECLAVELKNAGWLFEVQRRFPLKYKASRSTAGFRWTSLSRTQSSLR